MNDDIKHKTILDAVIGVSDALMIATTIFGIGVMLIMGGMAIKLHNETLYLNAMIVCVVCIAIVFVSGMVNYVARRQ